MAIHRDVSIDAYHGSANVSHSKLKDFAQKGPAYYHARWVTRTLERKETKPLTFGQAFELLFQQGGDVFAERVVTLPDFHGNDNRVKAAKAAAQAAGKLCITPGERADMLEMAASLREHDMAPALLAASESQLTLTADLHGLTIQSRPDYLVLDTGFGGGAISIDLKTCKSLDDMSDTGIVKLMYHTQAALVRRLVRLNGLDDDCTCYLLAVEKEPVYRCELIELPSELLDKGDQWLDVYAPKLADCFHQNYWPRARPGVRRANVPRWLQDEAA